MKVVEIRRAITGRAVASGYIRGQLPRSAPLRFPDVQLVAVSVGGVRARADDRARRCGESVSCLNFNNERVHADIGVLISGWGGLGVCEWG